MPKQRINMDIDSQLWKMAKKSAIDADIDLREWISQAIEEKLSNDGNNRSKEKIHGRVQS